jgi:lysophospholipase L1-like esterase
MKLRSGEKLLFVGDSITACMRESVEPPLGAGYVQLVHMLLATRYPELDVEFVNRGVDGNTILDLERRWDRDVIAEKPDWLFVMIGTNDVIYRHLEGMGTRAVSDEAYEQACERLIERTRAALDCRIVLLEPAPLQQEPHAPSHVPMRQLIQRVRSVGSRRGLDVVEIFERAFDTFTRGPRKRWFVDCPHLTIAGQTVLAMAVLDYLGW